MSKYIPYKVVSRRKIRLIKGNANRRHLKNLPVKALCDRCYLPEDPEPPSLYALYTCILWRAAHLCGQLPTIHVHIDVWPMYSINPIWNANCVRKYTSVYLLLSTNLFAFVFRVLLYWRPEWSDTQPNRPTTAAACNNQAAANQLRLVYPANRWCVIC